MAAAAARMRVLGSAPTCSGTSIDGSAAATALALLDNLNSTLDTMLMQLQEENGNGSGNGNGHKEHSGASGADLVKLIATDEVIALLQNNAVNPEEFDKVLRVFSNYLIC